LIDGKQVDLSVLDWEASPFQDLAEGSNLSVGVKCPMCPRFLWSGFLSFSFFSLLLGVATFHRCGQFGAVRSSSRAPSENSLIEQLIGRSVTRQQRETDGQTVRPVM
jgi:hypothetical protein